MTTKTIIFFFTLLISSLLSENHAWSEEKADNKIANTELSEKKPQEITIKLDSTSLEKTIRESIKEASNNAESKEKLELEKETVTFTRLTVATTIILALLTLWQTALSRRSITLSQKLFVSEQRPWVVVDKIIPASDFDFKSGLSFTFVIKNVGKSPALNIDVSCNMHLPHRGDVHDTQRNIRDDQARTREKLTKIQGVSFGHLLAPGGELNITVRCANDPSEYLKAAAITGSTGEVIIFIVGQISYRFDANDSWHESGFMYSVGSKGGQHFTLVHELIPDNAIEIKAFGAGFYAT